MMVLLVLGAVFGLISFIEELGHTRFDYDALAVARYTLLILPNQLVSLAPVIALLGSIVALASLDRFNELTIISCTGFPPRKLTGAIALPTLLLMAGLWLCMEYVTPQLQQSAERERHLLRYRNDTRIPGGVWSTNGSRYIHLGNMLEGGIPGDISLFEFDESGQLVRALHANTAKVSQDRRWLFQGVREKRLVDGELVTRRHKELEIANLWAADELPTLTLSRDSMALSVLYRYSQYLASNEQPMEKYLSAFWQKLADAPDRLRHGAAGHAHQCQLCGGRDRSFGINMASARWWASCFTWARRLSSHWANCCSGAYRWWPWYRRPGNHLRAVAVAADALVTQANVRFNQTGHNPPPCHLAPTEPLPHGPDAQLFPRLPLANIADADRAAAVRDRRGHWAIRPAAPAEHCPGSRRQQHAARGACANRSDFERTVLEMLASVGIAPTLGNMLLIILGGVAFKSVFLLVAQRQVGYTAAQVATDLRLQMLRAVLRSKWEYFLHQPVGKLTNALATEAQRSSAPFVNGATAITFLIQALIYGGIAFALSWRASLVAIVAGTVVIGLSHFLVRITRKAGKRRPG